METLYRNVRDKQTDRCSPMSRQLVCGVCLEASRGLNVLRAQGGRLVFLGNSVRTWHGCGHAARWGKKGQLEEEYSCYSSPVDGGCIPLGIWLVFQASGSGSGFGWGPEISECPSSPPPFLSRPARRRFLSHFYLLFCLGGFCLFFLTCFGLVLDFIRPLRFYFYRRILGLLLKRDVICSISDYQLSMLLQFSEEKKKRSQLIHRTFNTTVMRH